VALILIDTNLLIYLYDTSAKEKAAAARQVLDRLDSTRSGCLSVQNLAEFVSASTRKLVPPLSPTEALAQVGLLMRIWPVFDLTPMIVLEAARGLRDYKLAYYDAQIWAIARLNQVNTIFTEDFSDRQVLEGVRFVNPFAEGFRMEDWA
jgi:predicted nucleic acid-binding protein